MIYQNYLDRFKSDRKAFLDKVKKLKRIPGKELDAQFDALHQEVFEKIDCLKCAHCCKTISPIFRSRDIERIARSMRLKPGAFIAQYLHLDDEGDYVLNETPCPFLGKDNYCGIYEVRPQACREFPHTNHKNMHKHLPLAKKNLEVCPAVVEIVDKLD